jgi:uncharacterized membrane protein
LDRSGRVDQNGAVWTFVVHSISFCLSNLLWFVKLWLFYDRTLPMHKFLLLIWTILGACLRWINLGDKPPWGDEWCTLIFSLGHGYRTIPLDQIIPLQTLLQPLQFKTGWHPQQVIYQLLSESNHPPLYFLLTHGWFQLFPPEQGQVSLTAGRSLSALLGTLAIPLSFKVTQCFTQRSPSQPESVPDRSLLTAHLAAALMAVSPFGVYLSQEARHYTLSVLWILLLLGFFQAAVRSLRQQTPLPWWQVTLWIILNALGIATHFFYLIALAAVAFVLFWELYLTQRVQSSARGASPKEKFRIHLVFAGTIANALVWARVWQGISEDTALTHWLDRSSLTTVDSWQQGIIWILEPLGRLLAWITTMVMLLPIEGVPAWITIVSALLLFTGFVGLLILLRNQRQVLKEHRPLLGFMAGEIVMFWIMIYGLGTDLTLAPRYHFVYFPAWLILVSLALTRFWQTHQPVSQGKAIVGAIVAWGLLGSLCVVTNVAYQKPDQADVMVERFLTIQKEDQGPQDVLVAIAHRGHGETGKLMSLAWEFQHQQEAGQPRPQFLLAHWDQDANIATQTLHRALTQSPRPLTLWVVNFSTSHEVEPFGCRLAPQFRPNAPGYWSRLYYCDKP